MTYDIYGIGSALVDTEVEVSEAFLIEKNIDKGVMTLVNERRQKDLLDALSSEDFPIVRKCGGSVCNSVVAASNLGARTFFSGKVADDTDGELFISDLRQSGVDFYSAGLNSGITGKCLVMVTKDAERTMNTFLGASETFSPTEIDRDALKKSEWFFVEGYLVTDKLRAKVVKEAVDFAKANGVKIALSLSDPLVAKIYGGDLLNIIDDGIDLLFCNKDEAFCFTGMDDLESAIEELRLITKTFAITDGPNGSLTFNSESLVISKGLSVKAIDTNGAGDMFAGAFLYAITSGREYDWAAHFANECASRVVAHFGPRLTLKDFSEIKTKFSI